MTLAKSRWFGWSLVAAWCLALTHLVPLPPKSIGALAASYQTAGNEARMQPGGGGLSPQEIERQVNFIRTKVWIEWILRLSLIVSGFAASAATLRGSKAWPLLTAGTSSVYLYVWVRGYQPTAESHDVSWLSWLNVIFNGGDPASILVVLTQDLLLPLFHLLAALTVIIYVRPTTQ